MEQIKIIIYGPSLVGYLFSLKYFEIYARLLMHMNLFINLYSSPARQCRNSRFHEGRSVGVCVYLCGDRKVSQSQPFICGGLYACVRLAIDDGLRELSFDNNNICIQRRRASSSYD